MPRRRGKENASAPAPQKLALARAGESGLEAKLARKRAERRREAREAEELRASEEGLRRACRQIQGSVFASDVGRVRDARDVRAMRGAGGLNGGLFEFEAEGGTAAAFRADGDVTLYSAENLHKRRALACDKVVLKWIEVFWSTFDSVQKGGAVSQAEGIDVNQGTHTGQTALMTAAKKGQVEIARLLPVRALAPSA